MAIFIWFTGTRELIFTRLRHGRSPFGEAFGVPGGGGARTGASTAEWRRIFERATPPAAARTAEAQAPRPADEPPPAAPPGGARRPREWVARAPRGRRLTDEEIAAMEDYHGRILPGDALD